MPGSSTSVGLTATAVSVRGPLGDAVSDFSCTASPATLTAIAGPGGSGRTSLLLALAGRMHGHGGTVRISGAESGGSGAAGATAAGAAAGATGAASSATPSSALRERVAIARAIGEFGPDPYATIGELLSGAGHYARRRISREDLADALDTVGFGAPGAPGAHAPRTRFGALHPVDQLLLSVALVLPAAPGVILVDGVDRGLDDANRDHAWAALRSAAERGNTLIATCDSAEAARPHAHQVLGLNHPGPTPADSTTRKGDLR